uniref:NADH-ubiquinone oxidoreductase chain 2 n=1 Tax=Calophya californica TaxID=2047826 RepID=A0A343LDP6_9HEMI|nr:NADH dehydrogenase subunit 2 [Calophya californica]ATN42471.1 NADH dehydrogenase subunit 2 [Calophya californica]
MKNMQFSIFSIYILSICIGLSSQSWMMMWMSLEVNLLSFIFIILSSPSFLSIESTMKYFMIQSLGSLILLCALSMSSFFNSNFDMYAVIPLTALMLKSGIAPLHSWVPNILKNFPTLPFFLFLTMQKLVPTFILFSSWFNMLWLIILMNIIIGSISAIIFSSFKTIMLFSSINNIGWMFLSMNNITLFMMFFSVYLLMNFIMMKFINNNNVNWITQIKSFNIFSKMTLFTVLSSMSGLPPFMGFLPKWIIIKNTFFQIPMIVITGLLCSVLTLFFYFKMMLSMIILSSSHLKWKIKNTTNSSFFLMMNFLTPFLFLILT